MTAIKVLAEARTEALEALEKLGKAWAALGHDDFAYSNFEYCKVIRGQFIIKREIEIRKQQEAKDEV